MPTLREFMDAVKVVNAFADQMKDFISDLQRKPAAQPAASVVRTPRGTMPKGSWPRAIITAMKTMGRPMRVTEITQAIAEVRNVQKDEIAQTVRNAIHDLKTRGSVLHNEEAGTYNLAESASRLKARQTAAPAKVPPDLGDELEQRSV